MDILKRPLITEKISAMNERGVYGFVVEKTAKKPQIKAAVEKMYGVKVVDVRTMRYAAKKKPGTQKLRLFPDIPIHSRRQSCRWQKVKSLIFTEKFN